MNFVMYMLFLRGSESILAGKCKVSVTNRDLHSEYMCDHVVCRVRCLCPDLRS